ncbi:MAG TPA: hypothetical protein VM680_09280 [Verrucomicrobiae bacterium]|nr:hypothetical protein [Verrucomicrobiae bacterium]
MKNLLVGAALLVLCQGCSSFRETVRESTDEWRQPMSRRDMSTPTQLKQGYEPSDRPFVPGRD